MPEGTITLRSYRLAFEMERRIFRVDRFRIPVPYGLPLRGLAYWLALLAASTVLAQLPVLGAVLGAPPWPMRYLLLPGAGAYLLCRPRSDGRLAHDALAAFIAYRCSPHQLVAFKPVPVRTRPAEWVAAVVPDERGPVYCPGTVNGPAVVLLRQPARAEVAGVSVRVRQLEDRPLFRPRAVELDAGQRMVLQ